MAKLACSLRYFRISLYYKNVWISTLLYPQSTDPLTDIVPTRPEKNVANKDGNNLIG